jgi:hypothetical protein
VHRKSWSTGADAVVFLGVDGRLELIDASGRADAVGADAVAPVAVTARVAQRCGEAEAVAESGLDLVPFVFFVDTANSRGSVAHHRYDGHYGLITPA